MAAAHGRVFSEVRGKYTAWVYDSDMNTVYLSGLCVHTDFPLRPLCEPGCWPPEGLKAWQVCFMASLLDSSLVKQALYLLSYQIVIPTKQRTID